MKKNKLIAIFVFAVVLLFAFFGFSEAAVTRFDNPLKFNSVEGFLTSILMAVRGIIVMLSLVAIVIGAVMYVISAGSDLTKKAKSTISAALIGLAIAIAAPSFLKEISVILGWGNVNNAEVARSLTLTQISMNVLSFLLSTMGVVAMVMMVIGAMMYLTSAGDKDRVDTGKKIFQNALWGIFIAMISLILVKQLALFFSGDANNSAAPNDGSQMFQPCTTTDGQSGQYNQAGVCVITSN